MLAITVVSACSTVPEDKAGQPVPPVTLTDWRVSGKAAIKTDERSETVNILWRRQDKRTDTLQLSGPIGLGAVELTRVGNKVTWSDGEGEHPLSSLPLDSGARQAAAALPLAELGAWLLGHPAKNTNWQVEITQWQAIDGWRVPRILVARHRAITIRLVLLDWSFGESR